MPIANRGPECYITGAPLDLPTIKSLGHMPNKLSPAGCSLLQQYRQLVHNYKDAHDCDRLHDREVNARAVHNFIKEHIKSSITQDVLVEVHNYLHDMNDTDVQFMCSSIRRIAEETASALQVLIIELGGEVPADHPSRNANLN